MKWTTANIKNPNYTQNHEIYVGTHTGSFKKINTTNEDNPFHQKNLQEISKLDKNSRITTMDFGKEKSEILIGRANKFAQVHSLQTNSSTTSIELLDTPIVGLARYEAYLIGGFGTGKIQKLQSPEPLVISAGDDMSRLRQCPVEPKLIATGGKGRSNNLKVFDMETGKQVFTSKNLPNDYLQLEVPVWDSDIGFFDSNTVATCSRYGYVRLYDTRKQRRPVQHYANENQMCFTSMIVRDNYIYTGTTMGALKAFDTRRLKNFVHTYKGFTGSISDLYLDETGKYLASSSLDRYVRVHHTDSCVMLYQCYVKSKATRVLIRESPEKPEKTFTTTVEKPNSASDDDDNDCVMVSVQEDRDEDYDDIFDNMQTVCEDDEERECDEHESDEEEVKEEEVEEEDVDEENAVKEEGDTTSKTEANQISKRKTPTVNGKTKKKKI